MRKIVIGIGAVVALAILLATLFGGHGASSGSRSGKQIVNLQKQVTDIQKQVRELQQQLNEVKKAAMRIPPALVVPAPMRAGNVRARIEATDRPAVEIQDDIKYFQRKIRDKETDLALERENARRDTSEPRRNIIRRANIARIEAELQDMRSELISLVKELQRVPRP